MRIPFVIKPVLFLLTALLLVPSVTQAQDDAPELLFKRCANQVEQLTKRTTSALEHTTRLVVPQVEAKLEEGDVEGARTAARRGIHRLNEIAAQGTAAVRATCRPCIERLRRLEATELARRLANLCEESAKAIANKRERAVEKIKSLFSNDD